MCDSFSRTIEESGSRPSQRSLRKQRQRARLCRSGFYHLNRALPRQFLRRVDLAQIQNVALHHTPDGERPVATAASGRSVGARAAMAGGRAERGIAPRAAAAASTNG